MTSVTQDMKYKQSLMKYVERHGVSKASRKYNRSRSFIYFWRKRYDGSIESLACQSRRPYSHPNQHTTEEIKWIKDMRRRNPELGMIELWIRLRKRGYTRHPGSLYRVMRRLGMFTQKKQKKKYIPKPYEQMTYAGERVQIDVKHVPSACLVGEVKGQKLYQYTAIDEYSRLRYLEAFEEANTYTSAIFLMNTVAFFQKKGFDVECVRTDNGFEFTHRLNNSKRDLLTRFEITADAMGIKRTLIKPYTPRHNGKVERSHREDNKRFYSSHSFYSFIDFKEQLAKYLRYTNTIPMRPLGWLSPLQRLSVQYV